MALSHADRVKAVVKWLKVILGKTQVEIAEMCGYPNGAYFSMLLNGKKQIAASLDEKLAALHPAINVEFLRGNSEEMFLPQSHEVQPAIEPSEPDQDEPKEKLVGVFIPGELVQMFTDLSATVRSQQETIRLLMERREEKGSAEAVGL